MKLTDLIVSGLIKRGILYEMRDLETQVEIPREDEEGESKKPITIHIKCDHLTLKIDKEEAK